MYRIVSFICAITISMTAIPYPYMPYIPPSNAKLMDYIFNSYGVTALDEPNEQSRFEKYMTLYRAILGSSFDKFKIDIEEIFDNARTSRKIELSQTVREQLREGIKESINNGIAVEEVETLEDISELVAWINSEATPFNGMTTSMLLNSGLWRYFGESTIYAFVKGASSGLLYAFALESKTGGVKLRQDGQRYYYEPILSSGRAYLVFFNMSGYTITELNYASGEKTIPESGGFIQPVMSDVYNVNIPAERVVLETQSATVQQAINGDVAEVGTKVMILYPDGTIDITYPTVINLPAVDVVPATDVQDLLSVQEKLGVEPVTSEQDAEDIKQQLEEQESVKYGNTQDYALNLTEYFPFCIPFDIARVIGLFVAEPQTPVFQFAFPIGYEDGAFIMQTFEMDLAALDSIALWVRRGMLAVFVVGLGMVTRQVFLRG